MRHDPASAAVVVMLRALKMHGMAQAAVLGHRRVFPQHRAALLGVAARGFAATVSLVQALLCYAHQGKSLKPRKPFTLMR